MLVFPGLRKLISSKIQQLFNSASFDAPLTHSLVLERGTGSATSTRATTGSVQDHEGVLRTAIAGEARFTGARRVRNWIQAPTENWSNSTWTKSSISVSGNRLTATGANGVICDSAAIGMGTGRTALASVTLSRVTGTGNIDISINGGKTWTTVSVTGARVSVSLTGNINGQFAIRIVTSGDAIDATYPQLEDITGRADQTTPSEYVSVGVLSAPYHGAGVDGVKYFDTDLSTQNFAKLPGTTGSYIYTADSTANSITGDIQFVVKCNLPDYTPSAVVGLINKMSWGGTRSYLLRLNTSGTLQIYWTEDGTTFKYLESSAAIGVTGGTDVTLKAYLDVDNGATGRTARFYKSTDDGATWTEVGTAQTAAGTTSIYNSTEPVYVGYDLNGATYANGKIYRADIYNTIGGTTPVVSFDAANYSRGLVSSSTGETWVPVGNVQFVNQTGGAALPTSATYDAVWLNGVAGTYVSTPDSVAASITGDIDIRVKAALNDWTPGAHSCLVAKADVSGGDWAFEFLVVTSGALFLRCSADGSTLTAVASTASVSFTNGQIGHCRATRSAATGYVNFYTSSDGVTWTLLGDADGVTTAGGIFNSTQPVRIGTDNSVSYYLSGKIYQAQIYNGINGTLAVDFNASRYAGGTTLTGSTGETWTLQGSAYIPATNYPLKGYLAEGAATNYLGVTDAPATQTTASLGTGTYTLWVNGTGSAIASAGTATITGAAAATDGSHNTFSVTVAGTVTVTVTGSLTRFQLEKTGYPTAYIANSGAAGTSVTRNLDLESTPTASNIAAAASSVALEYTPLHAPSGTVFLWATYVDASNYTAILHDGTNLIMRKRIAATNYDATIANAFVSGTTYKAVGTWGAGGTTITLNGTEGTPHANTTAAQIGSTMQTGGDGNGANQAGMSFKNERIAQRQYSASERLAVTA